MGFWCAWVCFGGCCFFGECRIMKTANVNRSFISLSALVRLGAHYGHKASLLKSVMRPYVMGNWHGLNIVSVDKALTALKIGFNIAFEAICANANVLFLCNGLSYARGVAYALADVEQHCVVNEFGGIVTNWFTFKGIGPRLERYRRVIAAVKDKRLVAYYNRRAGRARKAFISDPELGRLPGAVVVFCGSSTDRVIFEANKMKVPVIGLADSFSEVAGADCVVPMCEGSNKLSEFMCELFACVCSRAVLVSRRTRLFGLAMRLSCTRIGDYNASQALSAVCCHFKSVYLVPSNIKLASTLLRMANVLNVKLTFFMLLSVIACARVTLHTPLRTVINLCKLRLLTKTLSAAAAVRLRLFIKWLECMHCLVSARSKPSADAIALKYGKLSSSDVNVKDHIPQPVNVEDSRRDYYKIRYFDISVVSTFDYFFDLTKLSGKWLL
ncbi:30S ribosomal protein S2 [Candidatus Hodgkinia cicadicola]|nr:30S ribosomal protein S2 [Candidatus Hodgkinia cicadicola]